MATAASPTGGGKKKEDDKKKKLTKVLSTKLSSEDNELLQQVSDIAFQYGEINSPTKSELVRSLITHLLSAIRKEHERLSSLAQSG